ncbi:MAG: HPP family protein [Pseudomonadota bacterium]|nr:HPP family protein [Pseudomonadota bacterium]
MSHPPTAAFLPTLKAFWPGRVVVDARERWRMVIGAGLGLLATAWLCHIAGANGAGPWLVAPIGASAVLVFCVPSSPLAQPWAVIGGNTLSALAGIACARWVAPIELAAALSVALAIGLMLTMRCLHPPGGAAALLMTLGGITEPQSALFPVLVNSIVLVGGGMLYNNLTRRHYPHDQHAHAASAAVAAATESDLDAVLARYNQVLDVSRDDLQALLEDTQMRAHQRHLETTRCADIMSKAPKTVEYGTSLEDAWALLRKERVKALPVIDRSRRIVGIVTLADFLKTADLDLHRNFAERLRESLRSSSTTHSSKAEVVGQIMSRRVRVTGTERHLADLLPLFGSTGHHHIPVIDEEERLVGIITQSDVVAALADTRSAA